MHIIGKKDWKKLTSANVALWGCTAQIWENTLYIYGGMKENGNYTHKILTYSIASGTWKSDQQKCIQRNIANHW